MRQHWLKKRTVHLGCETATRGLCALSTNEIDEREGPRPPMTYAWKIEGLPGSKLLAQLKPKEVALLRQALRPSVYHISGKDDETHLVGPASLSCRRPRRVPAYPGLGESGVLFGGGKPEKRTLFVTELARTLIVSLPKGRSSAALRTRGNGQVDPRAGGRRATP